jgi:hypothetical protein
VSYLSKIALKVEKSLDPAHIVTFRESKHYKVQQKAARPLFPE